MDALQSQLKALPGKLKELPTSIKVGTIGGLGVFVLLVVGAFALSQNAGHYEYAFAKGTADDGAAAAAALRGAGIPFRVEAGGEAVSVPSDQVHQARFLLASQGIPRSGGVGWELFDGADVGISQFRNNVNLQRAMAGELARTISSLTKVKSAKVHLTLPKRSLLRGEDRPASATAVVHLHRGRKLNREELAGIRHLVASGVPELDVKGVTVIDGNGAVLTDSDTLSDQAQRDFRDNEEQKAEQAILRVLEPAVGFGAVVTHVSAEIDVTEESSTSRSVDAENPVLVSKHASDKAKGANAMNGGVAGAAGNSTKGGAKATVGPGKRDEKSADITENYEFGSTVTQKRIIGPRLRRLSVAIVINEDKGNPRDAKELDRLTLLAKKAVGFNQKRGDQFELVSTPLVAPAAAAVIADEEESLPTNTLVGIALGVMLLLAVFTAVVLLRRRAGAGNAEELALLAAGGSVESLEGALAHEEMEPLPEITENDPASLVLDRAKELVESDPQRAAHLLHAWLEHDRNNQEQNHA